MLFVLVNGCDRQLEIQPSGKKVKVGIIGPFSAIHKLKGEEGLKGIKTALSMYHHLNNGDVVERVLADDQNKPEQTVKALEKLTEVDKVAVIIALSTSVSVLALLATHQDITKSTSYVSQLCFDNVFQGMVAALYVMDELLIDRAAVFKNPNSLYSISLADEFVRKHLATGTGLSGKQIEVTF